MTPQAVLTALIEKRDLSHDEMYAVMKQIMGGELAATQIAAILIALRCKGESIVELTAAAKVMRELSTKVEVPDVSNLIDTCGTGGDGVSTFNISTAACLIAAAAGAKVAKHGGRSVSSTCGSADVLEALGVNVNLNPQQIARCIGEIGVGFMFAPNHHAAMKYAAPVRKELGVRTLFNLLGPMTNPAGAKYQLIGVFHRDLTLKFALVLQALGSRHALIVHGADGLDEISLSGVTYVAELKNNKITEHSLTPERFGISTKPLAEIRVNNLNEAKTMLLSVLEDKAGPAKDVAVLNAGAAIYIAGCAASIEAGVKQASAAISSGAAQAKLQQLIEFSNRKEN
jgi:anthranilate phosphoribosyltransferase